MWTGRIIPERICLHRLWLNKLHRPYVKALTFVSFTKITPMAQLSSVTLTFCEISCRFCTLGFFDTESNYACGRRRDWPCCWIKFRAIVPTITWEVIKIGQEDATISLLRGFCVRLFSMLESKRAHRGNATRLAAASECFTVVGRAVVRKETSLLIHARTS